MDEFIEPNELQLVVARAKRRDPDAWEQLYRRGRPTLFRFARRRLPTDQAAEDAVSEVFSRAIARIEGFTWQKAGFDAWLYGIARNVVYESHRQFGRDVATAAKEASAVGAGSQQPDDPPGARLEGAEERDDLRRAFERLSDSDREILEYRVIGGLSSDEVAEILGKKPSAVRMSQARALERLRVAMKEIEHE